MTNNYAVNEKTLMRLIKVDLTAYAKENDLKNKILWFNYNFDST